MGGGVTVDELKGAGSCCWTHVVDASVVDDVLVSDRFQACDDVGASEARVSGRERRDPVL